MLGSKGVASDLTVVSMGQTSKDFDVLIIPDIDSDNQTLPNYTGGSDNWRLSFNIMVFGLGSDHMCVNMSPLIAPM